MLVVVVVPVVGIFVNFEGQITRGSIAWSDVPLVRTDAAPMQWQQSVQSFALRAPANVLLACACIAYWIPLPVRRGVAEGRSP